MTTSIQERHDAKMRLRLDASDGALIFEDFIGALAYDIGCGTRDPVDVMIRLADLIEPEPDRTCVVEHRSGGVFHLSCGHDSTEHVKPDYCPTCGARVVD